MANTAIALCLALGLLTASATSPNIESQRPVVRNLSVEEQRASVDLYSHLSLAAKDSHEQLAQVGIDETLETTQAVAEQMLDRAAHPLGLELGLSKVNLPPVVDVSSNFPYRFNRIKLGQISLYDSKRWHTFELVRAQTIERPLYKALPDIVFSPFTDKFAGTANRTFSQLVAWEVLANQALSGDILAKYVVLSELREGMLVEARRMAGISLSDYEINLRQKPVAVVLKALSGKEDTFRGVKIDGIVKLVNSEVSSARMSYPEYSTPSALEEYCLSPESKILCTGNIVDVTIEGEIYGLILFSYLNEKEKLDVDQARIKIVKDPETGARVENLWINPYDQMKVLGVSQLPLHMAIMADGPGTIHLRERDGRTTKINVPQTGLSPGVYWGITPLRDGGIAPAAYAFSTSIIRADKGKY